LKAYELKDHQAQKTDELKTLTIKKMHKIQKNQTLIKSFFMKKLSIIIPCFNEKNTILEILNGQVPLKLDTECILRYPENI